MNSLIKSAFSADIKKLLVEALDTLPHSLESNIEAAKGADAVFDAAAPNILKAISRLRFIFSEINSLPTHQPPDWQLIGRYLNDAAQINVSLLRLCLSVSEAQGAPHNPRGGGDALFLYEDSEYIIPVMCAVRTITDVIYDLQCAASPEFAGGCNE